MEIKYNKKSLLSFFISFLILYFLISRVEVAETLEVLKGISIWRYLAAFLVFYISFIFRGLRWKELLKNADFDVKIVDVSEIYYISWFVNCIVPAKLGDVYRGYMLKKNYNHPLSKVMGTIFVERSIDVITVVALLIPAGFLSFKGKIPQDILFPLKMGVGIAILLGATIFIVMKRGILGKTAPAQVRDIAFKFEEGISQSLARYSLPAIAAYTMAIWILDATRLLFVTSSVNVYLPFSLMIFVTFSEALLTAFPGTPAGLGAVELMIAGVLILTGVRKEMAVSVALLDRLITYWTLLLFGSIVYILSRKK